MGLQMRSVGRSVYSVYMFSACGLCYSKPFVCICIPNMYSDLPSDLIYRKLASLFDLSKFKAFVGWILNFGWILSNAGGKQF